jgi:Ca2+-binding RTX toxin-like protein
VKGVLAIAATGCACLIGAGGTGASQYTCTQTGTAGPDVMFGTAGPDVTCGLGGADKLSGMGGNDVLIGGPGNDYLDGGTGRDTLLGGPGNDQMRSYDFTRDVVDGGAGYDDAWTDHFDVVRNVEHR